MKSMLYIGATLMVGASIYGFVDYQQTHAKKEFKEMYVEEKKPVKAAAPVVLTEEKKAEPAITPSPRNKKVQKNEPVIEDELIEGIEPIAAEDQVSGSLKEISQEELAQPEPAKENKIVKKKKVRKEFFSRGRMPEEEIIIEPVKKESKKSVSKD